MSVLEYASKLMELSQFALAYVTDEKLKMNNFEAGLNLPLKKRMLVRQYTFYPAMYKQLSMWRKQLRRKMSCKINSKGIRGRGINEKITTSKNQHKKPREDYPNNNSPHNTE